jgi:hypothetical protein
MREIHSGSCDMGNLDEENKQWHTRAENDSCEFLTLSSVTRSL